MHDSIYIRNPNMVYREIAGELILVPIQRTAEETESIFVLNETGAALWRMVDGESTIDDIISRLLDEYDVDRKTLSKDVIRYIGDMVASGALKEV